MSAADSDNPTSSLPAQPQGSVGEVFLAFLKLGLTSFGGPSAHLAYFRTEFVERRAWLDDKRFIDLVALCQSLPGPATSQIGFVLGLGRARWPGAFAAWAGFTLPSAILLILFGIGLTRWQDIASSGAVHGLKVAAVAIVAHATISMARALCTDRVRVAAAVVAALLVLMAPSALTQLVAIGAGGAIGAAFLDIQHLHPASHVDYGIRRRTGVILLTLFAALLFLLPALGAATGVTELMMVGEVFRSGALVFGGGHVVLPALHASVVVPGWVSEEAFLAGYGAAQAVPGPMFAIGAYLGAVMHGPLGGWLGGFVMALAIFAPGLLLITGVLPFWDALLQRDAIRKAVAGASAAVVGLLAAALYDPLWTGAIFTLVDFLIALAGFALLLTGRISPLVIVIGAALAGWAFQ
ncbi:MAG TPA: chromate efflux transporter [Telluria sp.]|nr:chromate efflux transporter [Telluria sp.]